MPAGEPRQVVAELEPDGAAQSGRTSEADLPAQQVGPQAGEHEVEKGDRHDPAIDVEDDEYEVQRVEEADRRRGWKGLAAVLKRVPEEAVPFAQAPKRIDDIRVGGGVDVEGGDPRADPSAHVAEHPPGRRKDEQGGRQRVPRAAAIWHAGRYYYLPPQINER